MSITTPSPRPARGMAVIVVMMFIAILATMAVAFATTTQTSIKVAGNERGMHIAQAAAESGLEYMKNILSQASGAVGDPTANMNSFAAAQQLKSDSGAAVNLGGGNFIQVAGSTFRVQMGAVGTGTNSFNTNSNTFRVTVTGRDPLTLLTRSVSSRFYATLQYPFFDWGIFAAGPIRLQGNFNITSPDGSYQTEERDSSGAIVPGSWISGAGLRSLSVGNGDAVFSQSNASTVAGDCWVAPGATYDVGHGKVVNTNTVFPAIPKFEPTAFSNLATNINDANGSHTNVRITSSGAGSSRTLSGPFKGILYIESPNQINLSGAVLDCAIVFADVQNNGAAAPATDSIDYSSNNTGDGLQPGLGEVSEALAGYGVLAPTANIRSTANSDLTIHGSIICKTISWTGNSTKRVVDGSLIVLSPADGAVDLGGGSGLEFFKTANFVKPVNGIDDPTQPVTTGYRFIADSYAEGD